MLYHHDHPIIPPRIFYISRQPLRHRYAAMHTRPAVHEDGHAGTGRACEPVSEPVFQFPQRALVVRFVSWDPEKGVGYLGGGAGVGFQEVARRRLRC